jgi:hypothetical protein
MSRIQERHSPERRCENRQSGDWRSHRHMLDHSRDELLRMTLKPKTSIPDSTGPLCSLGAEAINCMFELPVDASPTLLPIKVNPFVRFYGRPFKNSAFPCVIGPGGNANRNPWPTFTEVAERSRPAVFSPTILARLFSRANATIISAALAVWRSTRRLTLP